MAYSRAFSGELLNGKNYVKWVQLAQAELAEMGVWTVTNEGIDVEKRHEFIRYICSRHDSEKESVSKRKSAGSEMKAKNIDDLDDDLAKELIEIRVKEKNAKALGILVKSINESYRCVIKDCETAHDAWKKLRLECKGPATSAISKMDLQKELFSMRLRDGEEVMTMVTRVGDIVSELKSMNFDVDEETHIGAILNALPSTFNSFVTTSRGLIQAKSLTKIADLKANLLHELQLKSNTERKTMNNTRVALVSTAGNTTGRRCFNCDSPFHLANHCDKPKRECKQCKRLGHIMKYCRPRRPMQQQQSTQGKASVSKPPSEGGVNSVSAAPAVSSKPVGMMVASSFMSIGNDEQKVFALDSGSTHHICKFANMFDSLQDLPEPLVLTVANYGEVACQQIGNITGYVSGKLIVIRNVLYIPSFLRNLLSWKLLDARGWGSNTGNGVCTLLCPDGDKIYATTIGDLWSITLEKANEKNANAMVCQDDEKVAGDEYNLWHNRLGHPNEKVMAKLVDVGLVRCRMASHDKCESCIRGKASRLPFPQESLSHSKGPLDLVHSDVCGPLPPAKDGSRYIVNFIDDYSRFAVTYLATNKSEVFTLFKQYEAYVSTLFDGKRIKVLRSDNGGEYVSTEFREFCLERGITHHFTVPYSPQQNGVAERENRSLLDMVRTLLLHASLPVSYWDEAVCVARYLRNRLPTRGVDDGIPYVLWYGKNPDYVLLRVFGSICFAHIPDDLRSKLDAKAIKCRFLGYASDSKGYRVEDRESGRIFVSRDVIFSKEQENPDYGLVGATDLMELQIVEEKKESVDATVTDDEVKDDGHYELVGDNLALIPDRNVDDEDGKDPENVEPRRHSNRSRQWNNRLGDYFSGLAVKGSFDQNNNDDYSGIEWEIARGDEIRAHKENGTWEIVKRPDNVSVVDCTWVYTLKGGVKPKARLVAKGYTQIPGRDYTNVYAPVISLNTIRLILALAVESDWVLTHLDVSTAFLNGILSETIYMRQPPGYEVGEGYDDYVCLLRKSIYGLKQSAFEWNKVLNAKLVEFGFVPSSNDPCLYVLQNLREIKFAAIAVHVDDMLLVTLDQLSKDTIVGYLRSCFKIDDRGEPAHYVGIEIKRKPESILLTQSSYISSILRNFGFADASPVDTPFWGSKLSQFLESYLNDVEKSNFDIRSFVGSVLYAAVATRPDCSVAVSILAQLQSSPNRVLERAAKRMLRYLRGTTDFGILYTKSGSYPELTCYTDADFAGNPMDRKSTSGYVIFLNGCLISWGSRKQSVVTLSTAEAEYIAASNAAQEICYLRRLLADLGFAQRAPTLMMEDNQGVIACLIDPAYSGKLKKNLDVRFHLVRQCVGEGLVSVEYCPTEEMLADIMTKPLARDRFLRLRSLLGLLLPR